MLILKIKEKGLFVDIPGAIPARTPAEIDISKCNLGVVDAYLRKLGIKNYQILSQTKEVSSIKPSAVPDGSIDQKVINKRFSQLENMVALLLEKQLDDKNENSEQITNKLEKLELLTKKILEKEPKVVERVVKTSVVKSEGTIKKALKKEPEIEELDVGFIPEINTSNLKIKGASKTTIKQESNEDLDDAADLLSRIMGQDD
jgi:hypothetical protein